MLKLPVELPKGTCCYAILQSCLLCCGVKLPRCWSALAQDCWTPQLWRSLAFPAAKIFRYPNKFMMDTKWATSICLRKTQPLFTKTCLFWMHQGFWSVSRHSPGWFKGYLQETMTSLSTVAFIFFAILTPTIEILTELGVAHMILTNHLLTNCRGFHLLQSFVPAMTPPDFCTARQGAQSKYSWNQLLEIVSLSCHVACD